MMFGIYAHLILDLFSGNGIIFWFPASEKRYAFFNKGLNHITGIEWRKAYSKTKYALFERIGIILTIIHIIFL